MNWLKGKRKTVELKKGHPVEIILPGKKISYEEGVKKIRKLLLSLEG